MSESWHCQLTILSIPLVSESQLGQLTPCQTTLYQHSSMVSQSSCQKCSCQNPSLAINPCQSPMGYILWLHMDLLVLATEVLSHSTLQTQDIQGTQKKSLTTLSAMTISRSTHISYYWQNYLSHTSKQEVKSTGLFITGKPGSGLSCMHCEG